MRKTHRQLSTAMTFILLMGLVALFSDMTHEGARSILGAYLGMAGASAVAVSFISGFGEFVGYSLRLLTGVITDKSKKYWLMTILGYAIDVLAIPALALIPENGWIYACVLVVVERAGKAIKKPAKNTLISFAASQAGAGKGFAIQEFIDQIGAFLGPVILFLVLLIQKDADPFSAYRLCFLVLGIPALITLSLLFYAKRRYPHPENFEDASGETVRFRANGNFWLYIAGICCLAFGFVDFPLITLHVSRNALVDADVLPLLYAGAMVVDAFAALWFGFLFDKRGIRVLILSTSLAAGSAACIFIYPNFWVTALGVLLWGIGMGAQESILKSVVKSIVPKANRAAGFGIFETAFGAAWFLGSLLMGLLYDVSRPWMVVVSVGMQLAAIPMFYRISRTEGGRAS